MTSPAKGPETAILRVADLSQNRATRFELLPDPAERAELASRLEILDVRKLTFKGSVSALGKTGWALSAQLGATVEQSCIVTLDPVVTRIDQSVERRFVKDFDSGLEDETEMPEDDTEEPLDAEIDLTRIMIEALTLALPDYPRSESAELETQVFAAPGVAPMTDAETKPFAGLADLKQKLEKGD